VVREDGEDDELLCAYDRNDMKKTLSDGTGEDQWFNA